MTELHERLRAAVAAQAPRMREDLERLVAIPSIAFDGFPREPLSEACSLVEELLRAAGARELRLVDVPRDPPTVVAEHPAPDGAPTVLLYAHYDVQPAPRDGWTGDPFAPALRDGRLHGRGAADDKSGVVAHVATLRAWDGEPPVGLKIVVEGGEETGRQRLLRVLRDDPELFRADVLVICDSGNWRLGEPTLGVSLRGHGKLVVEVRTLPQALHSGNFGGPAPDALLALIAMLASLHDERGRVTVEGLADAEWDGTELAEDAFRRQAGVPAREELIGDGTVSDRLWARHAISVLGLDAPAVDGAANIVIPHARARVAVRIPPGADPEASMAAVRRHLEAVAPWHADVTVTPEPASRGVALGSVAGPATAAAERALEQAFGKPVARMGGGGSIPLVAALREAYPDSEVVLWGAQDADGARIHGADEGVDLAELERLVLAQTVLLAELVQQDVSGRS